MIKIIPHIAKEFPSGESIKGTFTTPAGTSKLTGVMLVSTSILNDRDTAHDGFTLKLQINNRKSNPVNNDFDGGKDYPVFDNLTEGRIKELDCAVNRSEKIHYCILCNSNTIMPKQDETIPDTELKLYLIFE